jgi:hypothetical protein
MSQDTRANKVNIHGIAVGAACPGALFHIIDASFSHAACISTLASVPRQVYSLGFFMTGQ